MTLARKTALALTEIDNAYSLLPDKAEIADLDSAAVASEQQILKFEVTMGNSEVVHIGHGRGDLH